MSVQVVLLCVIFERYCTGDDQKLRVKHLLSIKKKIKEVREKRRRGAAARTKKINNKKYG